MQVMKPHMKKRAVTDMKAKRLPNRAGERVMEFGSGFGTGGNGGRDWMSLVKVGFLESCRKQNSPQYGDNRIGQCDISRERPEQDRQFLVHHHRILQRVGHFVSQ